MEPLAWGWVNDVQSYPDRSCNASPSRVEWRGLEMLSQQRVCMYQLGFQPCFLFCLHEGLGAQNVVESEKHLVSPRSFQRSSTTVSTGIGSGGLCFVHFFACYDSTTVNKPSPRRPPSIDQSPADYPSSINDTLYLEDSGIVCP